MANLLLLPQPVLDLIFGKLSLHVAATCSLVCSSWRNLPYERLLELPPAPKACAPLVAAGLWRCRRAHTFSVRSTTDASWPLCAAALCEQQLPALRTLRIQHSRDLETAQLQQLQTILQVQGPQCVLHLAVTDKPSLQALIPLLPFKGLAKLELNVPYVAEGMLQLLLHAATVQGAAMQDSHSSSSSGTSSQHATGQQPVLQVGVWVCCWRGCSGLQLDDAMDFYSKLQKVPGCVLTGCESIHITSTADLAALSQLQGLQSLGICMTSVNSFAPTPAQQQQQQLEAPPAAQAAAAQSAASSGAEGGQQDPSGLSVLTALTSSLQQLSMWGSPAGGWTAWQSQSLQQTHTTLQQQQPGQQQQQLGGQLCPGLSLSALTGLTKLCLQKDWSEAALSVAPIAALTLLRELALERAGLQQPNELCCLSSLTDLRALSLVLSVTADTLLANRAPEGSWPLVGSQGPPQQQQQGASDAVEDALGLLSVQTDGSTPATGHEAETKSGPQRCSCCCGAEDGPQAASSCDGTSAAGVCEGQTGSGSDDGLLGLHDLQQQVRACPVWPHTSCPVLLDWSWLRPLQQLETAILKVPHLDLCCLSRSLTYLDVDQISDDRVASITCSSSSNALCVSLPHLQHIMLPLLLVLGTTPADSCPVDGGSDGSGSEDTGDTNAAYERYMRARSKVQQHYEAALLLAIVQGCPELRELEVPWWDPPRAAVVAAAQHLRLLKVLSVAMPPGDSWEDLEQRVVAVRAQAGLRPVDLHLEYPLLF